MKRALLIALLLFIPIQAHAGAFVQAQKVDSSGTSVPFPAITVTGGNLLFVFVRLGGSFVTTTVSDGTNTWAQIAGASKQNDADADSIYVYYAKNIAGGSTTVTIGPSSSVTVRGHVVELSGADTTSPVDQSALTDSQVGLSASAGPITPTVAGMLLVGVSTGGAQGSFTAGTLGSGTATIPTNGFTSKTGIEYHNEAATASQSGSISFDAAETMAFASIFNFKDAAGGATCAPSLTLLGVGGCE